VTITRESEDWGIKLANYSTRLVLQAARNCVAGSRYERDLKRVFAAIGEGANQRELTRRTQWLKPRERLEIINDLQARGAISIQEIKDRGRPRTVYKRRRQTL
jgi:hypothetical protein